MNYKKFMIYYVNSAVLLNLLMPDFKQWISTRASDWKPSLHIIDIWVMIEETATVDFQYCWFLLHNSKYPILLSL